MSPSSWRLFKFSISLTGILDYSSIITPRRRNCGDTSRKFKGNYDALDTKQWKHGTNKDEDRHYRVTVHHKTLLGSILLGRL